VHGTAHGRLLRRCLRLVLQKSYGEEARLALSRWTLKESMPEDYYLVRDGKLQADRS
jgi:hypothetical protein